MYSPSGGIRHNRSLWLDIGIVSDVYGKSRYVQL